MNFFTSRLRLIQKNLDLILSIILSVPSCPTVALQCSSFIVSSISLRGMRYLCLLYQICPRQPNIWGSLASLNLASALATFSARCWGLSCWPWFYYYFVLLLGWWYLSIWDSIRTFGIRLKSAVGTHNTLIDINWITIIVVRESSYNISTSEESGDSSLVLVDSSRSWLYSLLYSCMIAVFIALISILEFELPAVVAGLCSFELNFSFASPSKCDKAWTKN